MDMVIFHFIIYLFGLNIYLLLETYYKFKYLYVFIGITEAIMYHEGKLELEGNEITIANASLNPKYRTVQHWHDTWRQNNLGPRIDIGVVEVNNN